MKTNLIIAWRNIWRNKRRTFITLASIVLSVFFAIVMNAVLIGFYEYAIDRVVTSYAGYIQVHSKGYWDDKILDNSMDDLPETRQAIQATAHVERVMPHLESFALSSSKNMSKGAMVIGTNFKEEAAFTGLNKKLIAGDMPEESTDGILISEGLAQYLKVAVNDSIVLIGSGYQGSSAQGLFRVSGILKFPIEALNKQTVYMGLGTAQQFYNASGKITSYLIDIENAPNLNTTVDNIKGKLNGDHYEVMPWQEVMPELDAIMKSEQQNTNVFVFILYLIVGFGVLSTVLMMAQERKKEFGVLVAIGMRKNRLISMIAIEILLLSLLGVFLGTIFSLPVLHHFHVNPIEITGVKAQQLIEYGFEPIMPLAFRPDFIGVQMVSVMVIICIAVSFPILRIVNLRVINALKK